MNSFYEPDPCVVTQNAVVLEDAYGNIKMRNTAHIKKFVEPGTINMEKSNPSGQPEVSNQTVDPARCNQPEPTASQACVQLEEALPSNSQDISSGLCDNLLVWNISKITR